MDQPTWRKATYSAGNGGACVEVGAVTEASQIFVRDTTDRQGPALPFSPKAWQAFADQVRMTS